MNAGLHEGQKRVLVQDGRRANCGHRKARIAQAGVEGFEVNAALCPKRKPSWAERSLAALASACAVFRAMLNSLQVAALYALPHKLWVGDDVHDRFFSAVRSQPLPPRTGRHAEGLLMPVSFGLLAERDVPEAMALSAAEGWNQLAADWLRLVQLEPSGCFAARDGDQMVGTVTTTTYGSALAWIGMMIIHPGHRRQGIGAGLMRMAIDRVRAHGIATVKLDATPAGRPLYESLGFVAEFELDRWRGRARAGEQHEGTDAQPVSMNDILALDRAAYGADRSRLLQRLVDESAYASSVARSGRGVAEGFALSRAGRTTKYIGPIIATAPAVAESLLEGMLAQCSGEEICLDVPRTGLLSPSAPETRGLRKQRSLTRMRLGPAMNAETAQWICASAGPAVG